MKKNYVMGDFGQMGFSLSSITNSLSSGLKSFTDKLVTVTVPTFINKQVNNLTSKIPSGNSQAPASAPQDTSSAVNAAYPESFFQKNKTAIMIGGGVVALGIVAAVIIKTRGAKK